MKKIIFVLFACLLCACAPQGSMQPEADGGLLAARWDMMQQGGTHPEAYRIQFSLRFGEEGETRRVTGILWGNNDRDLRLDIMAGVGAIIAKISDSGEDFLLYLPRENKAYFHNGANKPLLKVGVPVPFDLEMLAALLNGRFGAVFGSTYAEAHRLDNGNFSYALEGSPGGSLEIDQAGLPVDWRQGRDGWRMIIEYDAETRVPHSLKLSNTNGKKAIVLVKDRETPAAFPESQMKIMLPPNVLQQPLAKYKP